MLVVDDEWAIAEVLADILGDHGYRVMMAGNGKQALARLNDEIPHLVVLDFMMPIMDGAATLKALRANPQTAQVPVLLMSSLPASTIKERCSGYTAYIQKPFLIDEIVRKVVELLGDKALE